MSTQAGEPEDIRRTVRDTYGKIASHSGGCCESPAPPSPSSCCGPSPTGGGTRATTLGYGSDELSAAPEGSNLGLGCGNPTAIASLKPGETVLDLGSGGGLDCFLAAQRVGPSGRVIGVDMTPEMVETARRNAKKAGIENVEFRLGEIEHLPAADASVDVIISNCVINLSPEKASVFQEAFRVLQPGGRLAISDIVATAPLPETVTKDPSMICGCIGGAAQVPEVIEWLDRAGFREVRVSVKEESRDFSADWVPELGVEQFVASATIEAVKP